MVQRGLASLYEQSGEEHGRIHGYVNWRLPALQKAIKAKRVPPFETLCATTTEQFYHEDPGTNYAQARYLCYYLQEQGLLEKYYREFRAERSQGPDRLQDASVGAWRKRHGGVQETVGGVCFEAGVRLNKLGQGFPA